MKAVALTGIRKMEVIDRPAPRITADTDVLLKIEMVGLCGSDVHYYADGKIGSQVVQFPFVVGHECSATVAAVGPAVKGLRVGQRVVVEPAMSCSSCDQCLRHRENTCRALRFLGCPGQAEGCLCEYIVMPAACCFPADNISLEQGVLCEPFAIGVYAVKQAALQPGMSIAILGAGPIGLSVMAAARAAGVQRIYMTEKVRERIEMAAANGASWVGNPDQTDIVADICKIQKGGVDVAFECVGKQETVDQSAKLLSPGGKLMMIGIPRLERISLQIDHMRRNEIAFINVRRQNRCTQAAIDMIASGKVDIDFMITHRFAPEQCGHAFELLDHYRDGIVKAIINF